MAFYTNQFGVILWRVYFMEYTICQDLLLWWMFYSEARVTRDFPITLHRSDKTPNDSPVAGLDLATELTFLPIREIFNICNGHDVPIRDVYFPDTWFSSIYGFAYVLFDTCTSFPKLYMLSWLWISNIRQYFFFYIIRLAIEFHLNISSFFILILNHFR